MPNVHEEAELLGHALGDKDILFMCNHGTSHLAKLCTQRKVFSLQKILLSSATQRKKLLVVRTSKYENARSLERSKLRTLEAENARSLERSKLRTLEAENARS